MLGFDYVIGSQLAALSQFQKYFGVQQSDGSWIVPATYLSAWGAIGLGCDVVSSWLAAPMMEKYGRKPLILFLACVSTVAIVLQQMATNWKIHWSVVLSMVRDCKALSFRYSQIADLRAPQVLLLGLCSQSRPCGLVKPVVPSFGASGSVFVSIPK